MNYVSKIIDNYRDEKLGFNNLISTRKTNQNLRILMLQILMKDTMVDYILI